MTTSTSRNIRLLDAVEQLLLEASDEDILREAGPEADLALKQVSNMVRASRTSKPKASRSKATKSTGNTVAPQGSGVLLSYLKKLAKVQPQLSPSLSAAFSAKQTPNQQDIEIFAVELLKKKLKK